MTYNDGGNQFNMSTNSLELVVAELASINSFSPVAAGANLTTTVTVRTSFKTNVDYGPNVNYYCKLEGNMPPGNSTVVATIVQGETGSFTCSFFSSIIQTVNVTLTMVAKGIERTITSEKVSFSFIEQFFFEPSFGLHQGGELVVLKNYGGTDTNVTLNDFPQVSFNCSKIGANLNCTTPNLNLFPFIQKFNSFTLKLNNRTMSMKYVNYERFTLTQVHPRVIFISGTSFPLNISMNSVFSAVQGSAVLTIDDSTANAKRYDINLQNRMNITQTVDMFSEGRYPVQLFYKNSELFEIRNSIPMSDSVNIAFVSQKSISFVGANIFPVNQATNVTVSFGSGNIFSGGITMSSLAPLMKCRLGTQYVPTFYSPTNNDFTCTVSASTSTVQTLTIWYTDTDALSEFQVSSNSHPIIFVQQLSISNVVPHLTLSTTSTVTLRTNSSVDVFGALVTYQCRLVINPHTSTATRNGNEFTCNPDRLTNNHFRTEIDLWS
jgi:hypothetical protein